MFDEALAACNRGDDVAPAAVVAALARRAYELLKLGRWRQAVAACDELLARVGEVGGAEAQRRSAWALKTKAKALIELEEYDASLVELDRLLERFGSSGDEEVQASVAGGLENQAIAYSKLGSASKELAALEELTRRFASSTDTNVAKGVSFALYRQALRLDQSGDVPEALSRYNAFCERVKGSVDDQEMRSWWVRATLSRARLTRPNAPADAVSVLDDAAQQLEIASADDPQGWATLMLARAELLQDVDRSTESLVVLDAIVERLGGSGEPETRKLVARALIGKGIILSRLDREDLAPTDMQLLVEEFSEPALEALDEQITRHSGVADPPERVILAQSLLVKAGILDYLGRDREARATRKHLVAEFKRDADPKLAALAATTRDML